MISVSLLTSANTYSIRLPHARCFFRPLYAYNYLPGGWRILRRLLFGNTFDLCWLLYSQGSRMIAPMEMFLLAVEYELHEDVVRVLIDQCAVYPASDLADVYLEWENGIFERYWAIVSR